MAPDVERGIEHTCGEDSYFLEGGANKDSRDFMRWSFTFFSFST